MTGYSPRARLALVAIVLMGLAAGLIGLGVLQQRRAGRVGDAVTVRALVVGRVVHTRSSDQARLAFVTTQGDVVEERVDVDRLSAFPLGALVDVAYDPRHPTRFHPVHHAGSAAPAVLVVGVVLAVFGLLLLLAVALGAGVRRHPRGWPSDDSADPWRAAAEQAAWPPPRRRVARAAAAVAVVLALGAGLAGAGVLPSSHRRLCTPVTTVPAAVPPDPDRLPGTLTALARSGSVSMSARDVADLDAALPRYPTDPTGMVSATGTAWVGRELAVTSVTVRFRDPLSARVWDAGRHVAACGARATTPRPDVTALTTSRGVDLDAVAGDTVRVVLVRERAGGRVPQDAVAAAAGLF